MDKLAKKEFNEFEKKLGDDDDDELEEDKDQTKSSTAKEK